MDEVRDKILADIDSIIRDSSLDMPFFIMVLDRLEALGYTLQASDGFAICYAISKVENHIKNTCNINAVPKGLYHIACDRVCGTMLYEKNRLGTLEGFNIEQAIKQVSMGDTSVTYADTSDNADKLVSLLDRLINDGEGELICYRKLKW